MKRSLGVSRAIRYMATGGDQIELRPPRTPATTPKAPCQTGPGPIGTVTPNSRFSEKITIALPMATVSRAVG